MIRYTLFRLFLFFGILLALGLAGMRGFLLLVVALMLSAIVSLFLLAGPREQFADQIDAKVKARRARAEQHRTEEDEEE